MVTDRPHSTFIERLKSHRLALAALAGSFWLPACNESTPEVAVADAPAVIDKSYLVLDQDLTRLKQDFNAHRDQVRLLFIVGDTCGICLRGMADLNDAFLAASQHDGRLETFVVHVPTMGAKEEHVAPSIPLMQGPRIHHYWDGVGESGIHVARAIGFEDFYAWDVWLAYKPGATWQDVTLPEPAFWMHQLSPYPDELRLDADVFGEKTLALMASVGNQPLTSPAPEEASLLADGTRIGWVGQPLSVPVRQHIQGVGGFPTLSRIARITATGALTRNGRTTAVTVLKSESGGLQRSYHSPDAGLPSNVESTLQRSFDLNGPIFEWKDRGHQLRLSGMLKIGPSLAWKIFVKRADGTRQVLYLDSHNGDIVLMDYMDERGELQFSLQLQEVREIDGVRFAHSRVYLDPHGVPFATEQWDEVELHFLEPAEAEDHDTAMTQ